MLSPEALEMRRQFVGASDFPSLLGKSPMKSIVDIWKSKIGPVEEQKETEALRFGNLLEDDLITLAADYLKAKISTGEVFTHGVMLATLDGRVSPGWQYRGKEKYEFALVECKTAGFAGPPLEIWGRGASSDVPPRVMLQCQYQLHVVNKEIPGVEFCWVSFLGGHDGKGHRMYPLRYDKKLGERMESIVNQFWDKYVLPKIEPPLIVSWD